jgi:SAM-dependent methyltransferase
MFHCGQPDGWTANGKNDFSDQTIGAKVEKRIGVRVESALDGRGRQPMTQSATDDTIEIGKQLHWKRKSTIQRVCAALPAKDAIYYFLQRHFGSLRHTPDPLPMLRAAAEIFVEMRGRKIEIAGRRIMEIGTGRRLDMPIAFYLCGARQVDTFDQNEYLREELVMASLGAIRRGRDEVLQILGPVAGVDALAGRLDILAGVQGLRDLREKTGIRYHAPADASRTGLADNSVDLQFSYTVFEHIPGPVLEAILREASRVLSPDGIACHHIDPSDHFAHEDRSIGLIHFLRFEEREWSRYNDNQFAYHNRLRRSDYDRIYAAAGHDVFYNRPFLDQSALAGIRAGFPLATPFQGRDPEDLCTVVYRVYSRPGAGVESALRGGE